MKKWIGFFVVLAVLILVAFYAMGFMIKSTFTKNINSIPDSPFMSVQLEKYRRGFFSSQAVLKLKIHVPAQQVTDKNGAARLDPPVDMNIDLPILIKHGPIICSENGIRFGLGLITTKPETHYQIFINYLNKMIANYSLPSFAIRVNPGPQAGGEYQLNWKGLDTLFKVSTNLNDVEGNLKLYGLDGSGNNTVLKIDNVGHKFKYKRHQNWLWLGQSKFKIPFVLLNQAGQKLFELKDFSFMLDSDAPDDALYFDWDVSMQNLYANAQSYGPGRLKLNIKNLDSAAMANIMQQSSNMLQENGNSDAATAGILAQLPKLLSRGPVMELSELALNLPEGKVLGNFKLSLPNNVNDPNQIVQKMQGEGQFRAPIATVRQLLIASTKSDLDSKNTPATNNQPAVVPGAVANPVSAVTDTQAEAQMQVDKMLQALTSKGFLKVEGSDYVLIFKLENQQLIINGQPFNPNMLQ
ncbi:YdgA family protein [Legionella hackeliae]|uniref:Uncharacterized protein n=1 Tax=Legionella hackeliae TaxID=449 RepID=A0A0A8UWU7_LEGHA|nr:YdgA family protein [Legionella hackeliae]KTD13117.1 putative virulence protein [Legionella hackeliae]CEK11572.1 conserved exported protein of unknown function [Legionella hackeliae]STX48345.1 putative virulence protein [Legionella hackeliae]